MSEPTQGIGQRAREQRGRRLHRRLAATSIAAATVLVGCGGASKPTATPLRLAKPRPILRAPGASLQITSPAGGSTQQAQFTVHVQIRHYTLTRSTSAAPRQGYGHLRFTLDHGRYDQPQYSGP